jgi:DNA-binding SARP family transcriptional activator
MVKCAFCSIVHGIRTKKIGRGRMTSADARRTGRTGRQTRFTVLGMLGVADGRESAVLQPSRPAALLAALLLHANSVVSAETLQRVIWGEDTPAQAKSALHSCVLRLRRLFAKYGISENAIEAVPGGYRITADAETLDLVEFRELLSRAYAEKAPESELALLRTALDLWHPPLLANVPSDLLHRDEVPRLHEEWLRAIERVFDLELTAGRHRQAVAEILQTARAHPLHERFTEQLMEALHRAGRRAEALAEYRKTKEHLAHHLGVDPGPSLQRLELAILRGEAETAAPTSSSDTPQVSRHAAKAGPASVGPPAAPAPPSTRARPTPAPAAANGPAPAAGSPPPRPAGGDLPPAAPAAPSAEAPPPDPGDQAPISGARVLDRLVGAGLLEEGPRGHYRIHELLRAFARAAAAEGVGARSGGRTPHPPSRPGAAELHPTEA